VSTLSLSVKTWNFLGGFDARVPCYAGGIDLDLALDKLLRQTDDNLAKGFRAIKMKVGRKRLAEDIERVKAMRAHLGEGVPLMVDANMKWSVDEAIRAAPGVDAVDWVERIPFAETRNYVQRVMENLQAYRARFFDANAASPTCILLRQSSCATSRPW
jgi:L-alanine-DL-glutamate epimerase-like enolase superfamily enzyme